MRPKISHVTIDGRSEAVLNATAVVEFARGAGTPETRRFLSAYHVAEAEIAARNPSLREEQIRADAMMSAFRSLGVIVKILPPDTD